MNLQMTAGRDYRFASGFEYVLIDADLGEDGEIVARAGGFKTNTQAKRAGVAKAAELYAADPQQELAI